MHYSMKKAEKAVTHAIKALIEATKALLSALTAGGWIIVAQLSRQKSKIFIMN